MINDRSCHRDARTHATHDRHSLALGNGFGKQEPIARLENIFISVAERMRERKVPFSPRVIPPAARRTPEFLRSSDRIPKRLDALIHDLISLSRGHELPLKWPLALRRTVTPICLAIMQGIGLFSEARSFSALRCNLNCEKHLA